MTSRGDVPIGIAALRDAVRDAVEGSSLRQVADDVGMSFNGLRAFIEGGKRKPQAATIRKLTEWYERAKGPSAARRAVEILRRLTPDERRKLPVRLQRLLEYL